MNLSQLPARMVIRHGVPGEPIEVVVTAGKQCIAVPISDQAALRYIEALARGVNANAAERHRRGTISDMRRDGSGPDIAGGR